MNEVVYEKVTIRKSHKYREDEEVIMREVTPGHFVLCSQREFDSFANNFNIEANGPVFDKRTGPFACFAVSSLVELPENDAFAMKVMNLDSGFPPGVNYKTK